MDNPCSEKLNACSEILTKYFFFAFSIANSFSTPENTWEMTYAQLKIENFKKCRSAFEMMHFVWKPKTSKIGFSENLMAFSKTVPD